MLTLQQTSALSGHRPTGFDYLRILLAVFIVAWHSVSICYGAAVEKQYFLPIRPLILTFVPAFFALSGFLVAGSLFRTNHLPSFLTLRALRIFPALCVEVVISALIIGAALTTLPLNEYFSSPMLHKYFLNILGIIQYTLPGVFADNNTPMVNGQLWTIPYELECYIAISILYVVTLHRRPRTFVVLLALLTVAVTLRSFTKDLGEFNFKPSGRCALWSFLWGVALYTMREKIRHSTVAFVACVGVAWVALQWREGEYFASAAIAYITVYIGLIDFRKTFVLRAGDISYGIYLYSYAIQQAVYQLLPEHRAWHENFIVSLVLSCCVGYLSWTYVEEKVLNRKKQALAFVKSATDRLSAALPKRT